MVRGELRPFDYRTVRPQIQEQLVQYFYRT
jgi:hypothetical protein